jgi:hypothetical protein
MIMAVVKKSDLLKNIHLYIFDSHCLRCGNKMRFVLSEFDRDCIYSCNSCSGSCWAYVVEGKEYMEIKITKRKPTRRRK